jgi:hypothetical protein
MGLGEPVRAGDLSRANPFDRPARPRDGDYLAQMDGILGARHFPGLVGIGYCLAVVAAPQLG